MKRLLKKGLSLLLAVLMVVSMLPTSAWALTFADGEDSGHEEVPVVDEGGADSSGGHVSSGLHGTYAEYLRDDPLAGEETEEPEPSEDPGPGGELLWSDLTTALSFTQKDGKMYAVVKISGSHPGASSGPWGLAIVPDLHVSGLGYKTAIEAVGSNIGTGNTTSGDELRDNIASITGLTAGTHFFMADSSSNFNFDASGNKTVEVELPDISTWLTELQGGGTIEGADSLDVLTGLPLSVILYTQQNPPGFSVDSKPYHVAGHIRDEVYTLDLGDMDDSSKFTFDGGSVSISMIEGAVTGGTIGITLTNDGTENVKLGAASVSATAGWETVSTTGEGATVQMGQSASDVITVSVDENLAPNTSFTLQVPYTYGDADNPIEAIATVVVNVVGTGIFPVSIEPVIFVMEEGDTDTLTRSITIKSPAKAVYSADIISAMGLEDNYLTSFVVTTTGTADGDGNYFVLGDDADATDGMNLGIGQASFSLEFTPPVNDDEAGTTALTQGTHLTQAGPVNFYNANGAGLANIPVTIIVKPKQRATWTITYDVNGVAGVDTPASASVFQDADGSESEPKTVTIPTLANTSTKKFLGWSTNAGDTAADTTYKPGEFNLFDAGQDIELFAIWEDIANTFTLTYNANAGGDTSVKNIPSQYTYSGPETAKSVTLTFTPTPTRDGYVFKGWSNNSGTSNKADYTNETGKDTANLVANTPLEVFAVWAKTYSVTYQDSTTTGHPTLAALPEDTNAYESGAEVTVSATPLQDAEQKGADNLYYKFAGWKTGETTYAPGDKFNISADTTLEAQWAPVNITVTLNNKGHGTISGWGPDSAPTVKTIQKGDTVELPTLSEEGYTFGGWAASDGGNKAYDGGDTTSALTENTTYYAIWTAQTRTVTFMRNHDADDDAVYTTKTPEYNTALNTDFPAAPSWDGYDFGGWFPNQDGTGTQFTKDTVVTADTIVYAKWTPIDYTVTYASAGNFGTVDSANVNLIEKHVGETINVSGETDVFPDTEGSQEWTGSILAVTTGSGDSATTSRKRFDGWSVTDSIDVSSGSFTMPAKDVVLTAQWVSQSSVKFDVNDGVWVSGGGAQTQSGDVDGAVTMPTAPTRAGYSFGGWQKDGTGAAVTSGITFPTGADATDTYVAKWNAGKNDVYFYLNYKSGSDDVHDKQEVTTNTAPTQPADPTREGYTFDGWYKEPACTNEVTDFTAERINANPTNYYAKWKINVTYVWGSVTPKEDLDGTAAALPSQEPVENNGSFTVAAAPAKDKVYVDANGYGYTFGGWSMAMGSTTADKDPGVEVTGVTAPVTLTGKWTNKMYNVTYKWNDAGDAVKTPAGVAIDVPTGTTVQHGKSFTTADNAQDPNIYMHTDGKSYKLIGWSMKMGEASATDVNLNASVNNVTADVVLTARWQEVSYTVTYDYNYKKADDSAMGTYTTDSNITHGAKTTKPTDPSRSGYRFAGWYTNTGCTTAVNFDAAITANVIYYAKWVGTSSVAFDLNDSTAAPATVADGKSVPATQTGDTGETIPTAPTAVDRGDITRTGYTFRGWAKGKTNGVPADAVADVSAITFPAGNGTTDTYYAIWVADVPVTFNGNGGNFGNDGEGAPILTKTTAGEPGYASVKYTVPADPSRAGYSFKGWAATAGGAVIAGMDAGDQDVYPTSATNYYAQWDRLYNVQFVINHPVSSATTTPASKDKVTGQKANASVTLDFSIVEDATAPATADYVFAGWNTAADGSGTGYTSGSYTVTDAHKGSSNDTDGNALITLYGQWTKKINVKFVAAAGDTGVTITEPNTFKEVPGTKYTAPTATRPGYDFADWSASITGTTVGTVPSADVTYTATWTAKKYDYTFDANNGEWTADHKTSQVQEYETDARVSAWGTDPERTGYTFKGWTAVKDTGPVLVYTDDDHPITMPAKDVTVYALWEANTYKVTYDPGVAGGDVGASIVDLDGGTNGDQDFVTFVYDGTSISAKPGDKTTTGTAIQWADGKGDGWTFKNWKSSETGTPSYDAGADLETTKKAYDFKLTAQWTVDVTFELNEPATGSIGDAAIADPNPVAVDHNGTIANIDAKLTGTDRANWNYTFLGWYTTDGTDLTDAPGTKATDSTQFTEPTTLYARWEAKQYTVDFVDNDSDEDEPEAVTDDYGEKFNLPDPTGTKMGYTFTGWFDKDEDDNTAALVGVAKAEHTITKKETLYGHWTPANVTITYLTDVGKAPEGTTKKYDATDYQAPAHTAITKKDDDPSTAGWNAANTIFTDAAGKRWQFNGWDILKADNTVLKQVAGEAAINPVNTVNGVVHTPASGDTPESYTLTLKANWTQLYSIIYNANDHGTVATQPAQQTNVVAGTGYKAAAASLISAEADDTYDSTKGLYTEKDGAYWSFKGWDTDPDATTPTYKAGNNVTLPGSSDTGDVTLYAIWESQVEVKLGEAADAKTADNAPTATDVKANLNNQNRTSGHTSDGVFVAAGTAVKITNLSVPTGYIFAYWTADDGTGDFDATKTDKVEDAIFTPSANTTLTPYYWKTPTLSGTDGYHLNFTKDANMEAGKWSTAENKKAQNTLPQYTWTGNDATRKADDVELEIQIGGTWKALKVTGDDKEVERTVDTTNNIVTYTFQESYLRTLGVPDGQTVADYPIQVISKTPDYTTTEPNAADTTKQSKLQIVVTPDPLTEVNVWAKGRGNETGTAKVGGGTYDDVHYHDHTDATIVPTNTLTYIWYVTKNHTDKPTQKSYTNTTTGASGNNGYLNAAKQDADTMGTVILASSTNATVPVDNASYKGKWIYAVVSATNTGYGAVITNSIAVDYDAVILVNKDNDPIPGNKADGYRVFLVPSTAPADLAISAEGNLTGTGVVPTTNGGTNNVYATADSALTGGVTYYAYVNKVEGNFDQYEKTSVSVSTQVNADAAGTAQTIDFYSVNAENTDKFNKTDSKGDEVGESFGDADAQLPGIGFTTTKTGGTITVPDGNGVLKGSKVTAKTDDNTWTQDYQVNWGVTTTEPTGAAPLAYTTLTNQTRDEAHDDGTDEKTINQKTWMGAQLEQRVYQVAGPIWAMGAKNVGAGIVESGADVPTLTFGTYRFDGTVSGSGIHRNTVTFTVPKSGMAEGGAITGQYVLSATPKTTPKTTILKLAKCGTLPNGNDTAADNVVESWDELESKNTLGAISGKTDTAFAIVVAASTYVLDLAETGETDNKTAHADTDGAATTHPVASGGAVATRAFSEFFGDRNTTGKSYTFRLTNSGNTSLTVSLKVQKGTTDVYGTGVTGGLTYDSTDSVHKDTNSMTFAGLQESFTLAAGAQSNPITVTIPSPLKTSDVADYTFAFTSIQTGTSGAGTVYGPSVSYKLTEAVTPLKITGIAAKTATAADKDFEVNESKLVLSDGTNSTTGKSDIESGKGFLVDDQVEYTWWRGPYTSDLSTVANAFQKSDGTFSGDGYALAGTGKDYKIQTADQGSNLYVVAKNKGTGDVIEAAFNWPATVAVPYDMKIQINENDDPVKDANKGNYDLYLVPTGAVDDLDWTEANLAGQGILTGAHDATGGADQGKWAVTGLVPGTKYHIYTNAVGGDHAAANRRDSGETVQLKDFTDGVTKIVTYHNVVIENTVADNSPYTIATSDNQFVNTADGTTTTIGADSGALVKPSASYNSVTVATDNTTAADRWVQEGTTIALSYKDWKRDYKLEWSKAASGTENGDPSGDVSSTATVNDEDTTVGTKLTLNTYAVTMQIRGAGSLDWVTLTDKTTGKVFTTNIGAGDLHATGDDKTDAANGKTLGAGSYTFTVPKGNYTITAQNTAGTTIKGYEVPIGTAVTGDIADETLAVQADGKSFLIDLQAVGQTMQVEDDQKPVNGTTITAHAIGTGSVDGVTVKATPGGSTIHLPYGYETDKTVKVEVRNASDKGNNLYNVKWTEGTHEDKITAVFADMDGTKHITYPNDADAAGTPYEATLTVATGLAVGTYTYNAVVSFNSVENDNTYQPQVSYTLTVVVDPAEFNAVSITKATGAAADIGTAQVELGVALKPFEYHTTLPDLWDTGLITETGDTPDFSYHWFYTDPGKTVDITWDEDTGTIAGGADATEITDGVTGNVLSAGEIAKHPGKLIYLAVVAAKDKNVIKAAVSQPVTTGFQPVVKIAEDHVPLTSAPDNTTDYVVTLTQGSDIWPTVWDATAKGFVPVDPADSTTKVSLDATKSYTANVNKYKGASGDAADLVAQSAIPLDLDNQSRTVDYFTVNAVKTKAFAGIAGLGEEFGGGNKDEGPVPTLKHGANVIANGTPVLKGQSVSAAIATADKWTKDYKLTWYDKQDGNASGTDAAPTFGDAYEDANPTMTKRGSKQDADTAEGTGHTVTAVDDTTYIGGRLDQNTYTIKATVKGTGTLSEVTLKQMDGGDTSRRDYAFTGAATDDKVSTSASGNSLSKDQYVTFTVVKGGFDLAAIPGDGTVISSMVWEGTDTVNDGAPLTGKTVAATGDGKEYAVTINLIATELKLKVADDGGRDAESDAFTVKSATNSVERYFNYIRMQKANAANPDTYEYELTLTNPGNKDLYAAMDVYYFADPSVLTASYYSTPGNWEAVTSGGTTTPAVNTPIFSADASTTATDLTVNGRKVLSLSDLMATGSKVVKDNGGNTAVGKLTLETTPWVKDDGAFVFRFKGTTGTASDDPVYVYYVLDLTVDQLPIKEVATNNDGTSMPGVGDVISVEGYAADATDASLSNVKVAVDDIGTKKTAAEANLTNDDVHFAWVKVAAGATKPAAAAFTVATDGTLASTTYSDIIQGKAHTLVAADMDHDFYLVAFAPNYTGNETNAKDMVISDVVQAKRTVGVQVSLDNTTLPSGGTADPGYTIYFVEKDGDFATGKIATTWSADTNKVYQAPVDMNKEYDVYAATTKGGSTFVKTGKLVGKGVSTIPVVPYWSVEHTANVAVVNGVATGFKSYLPDGNASSDNAIQDALSVKVSKDKNGTAKGTEYEDDTLAASVPVLDGMNVQVTVDGTKDNNNATTQESWEDKSVYHTLTTSQWNKDDTATSGSKIAYGASIVSGNITVSAPKNFTAKLEPVLFQVTFKVKDVSDPTPSTNTSITAATLTRDATQEPNVPSSFSVSGTLGTENGKNGDTVTFDNVPVGAMTVSASEGNKTMVVGYTWNDATAEPDASGEVARVTTEESKNKNDGNLIVILEATNMIQWQDNFNVADGQVLPDNAFVKSAGFQKVDGRPGKPDLALKTGYTAADVLEYKVRVFNMGTTTLENFQIDAAGVILAELGYSDLTSVTRIGADGEAMETTADVANPGFHLPSKEGVEFTVTIPAGKAAQDNYYNSSVFKVKTSNEGSLGGGDYKPAYQVKGNIGFTDGKAEVIYGDAQLKSNTPLALTWDGGATEPTFHFDVLTLSGRPEDAATDAATLALINDKLGLTGANVVTAQDVDAKPVWLTMNANTGAMSFTTGEHATGVNVEVNGTPADFTEYNDPTKGHKVDNEVVLYLKATEQLSGGAEGESFVVRYVVDVEPGQLYIGSQAQTQDTDWSFDPKNPENATKRPYGGKPVNKGDFHYTSVVDQAGTVIVTSVPLDNANPNTANGNKTGAGNETSGEVYNNTTHLVTWTLSQNKYVYNADNSETEYPFTVTYKPNDAAEKWNYMPNTVKPKLNAEKPPEYTVTYDWNDHEPDGKTLPSPSIVDPNDPAKKDHTVDSVLTKGAVYKATDNLYYTFNGWVEDGTDPAVSHDPGTTFTPTGDVTLLAQWTAKMLDVTYKYNGNGTPDKTITGAVQQGDNYTVAEADPTWDGRTFLGWTVTGGTPSASPLKTGGAVNSVTTNVVLTAQWERDQSEIVYDWNYDGSTDVSHTGNTGEADANVPATAPSRTGWTWDGKWYVEDACATEQTTFKFPADKGDTVTYYAKWTRDTSKIAFALDGGTLAGYPETYEGNTSEPLAAENFPGAAPTKAGYTFTGWKGDDGKTYTSSALPSFPAAKDTLLTVTAQWSRDQATITFDLNGGSIDGETDNIVRNGPTGTLLAKLAFPDTPVREGYAFEYWLGEDAKIYTVDDRPTFPAGKGGNLTVTAQWRKLVQGLKFSDERGNDAAVNDAGGKITLVDPDGVLTAPELQKAFPPARKVERTGEYVVYLDTEPRYTVALHSVGDPVYNVSVTATDARGVTYDRLPTNVVSFSSEDGVEVIELDLSAISGRLWAGEHHILLTAKGYTTEVESEQNAATAVSATYELTFEIKKRPIPAADLTPDPTDPTDPDKIKVTGKDGEDLRKPDGKGNTPVDKPTVTKTPTDPKPGETYEIKIDLEPDPNYIFEPENDPKDPTEKPNYTVDGKGDKDWPEGDKDVSVTVKPEEPGADVSVVITKRQPLVTIGAHLVAASSDAMVMSSFNTLIGQELRAYRAQSDDTQRYPRTGTTYGTDWWWSMGDAPGTVLDIQPGTDKDGKEIKAPVFEYNKTYVLTVRLDPDEVNYRFVDFQSMTATFDQFNTSLKRDLTRQANAAALTANTEGFTILVDDNGNYYLRTFYRENKHSGGGGGGGGGGSCPSQVTYLLGLYGTTKDPVMEMVSGTKATKVPNVTAITGYKFLGWSLAGPIGDADKDAARTLVDPKEVPIGGDTTFYAVYQPLYQHGRPFHKHYVIGYPNGNFGPSDNINRASVATIIARAVLPNFVEGADYGNPGNYADVDGHWAASAIAYCTRYGVFKGYEDGTFRPDQPISRQELVLTLARLSGMQEGTAPFSDLSEAGDWAKGGIYTAYVKGWVNGYTDGTFRPTNPIARDETVKIFNAYLYRGVNAEGLSKLTEYVHSGVASNNTENGTTEYMTWPDVPKDQWAYYEIIEAANDHEYVPDVTKKAGYTVPEVWTKCWIDEKWRYNDDANDGGPANVTMALLRKYGLIA